MKHALVALLLTGGALAQDRIPDEEARKIAKTLVEAGAKVKSRFKAELDSEHPFGKHKDEHAAMVLPVKNLTAQTIAKAGEELVPIGQVWMHRLVPLVEGKPAPASRLNMLTVTHNDREHTVALCWLAVRKGKDGPVLVLLGSDNKPLLTLPLEKSDEKQELPIEYLATIDPDERASIVLQLGGKYKARLQVGATAE
jgi:hypothetical protein